MGIGTCTYCGKTLSGTTGNCPNCGRYNNLFRTAAENNAGKESYKNEMDALAEPYNKLVRYLNANDWNGVIQQAEENKRNNYSYYRQDNQYCKLPDRTSQAELIIAIAHAYRDNDYQKAFEATGLEKTFQNDEIGKLKKHSMEAGKKAWERVNGRAMTEAELRKNGAHSVPYSINNFSGKGKYIYAVNYAIYDCDWKFGYPNGKGTITYIEGNVYEGDIVRSYRQGKGKMTYTDGSYYEGDWVDGWRNGKGKMTYPDGKVEEGNWKKDKFKGKGLFG